jgi:hypothetical protein
MDRWVKGAAEAGLEIVFLSVEYRTLYVRSFREASKILLTANIALTHEAPQPAQQEAFLNAYHYVLNSGISPKNIIFMGDSAGGMFSSTRHFISSCTSKMD